MRRGAARAVRALASTLCASAAFGCGASEPPPYTVTSEEEMDEAEDASPVECPDLEDGSDVGDVERTRVLEFSGECPEDADRLTRVVGENIVFVNWDEEEMDCFPCLV